MTARKLFTIGFTRKSAEEFFNRLSDAGVKRVIDVRLNNVSQRDSKGLSISGTGLKFPFQDLMKICCPKSASKFGGFPVGAQVKLPRASQTEA